MPLPSVLPNLTPPVRSKAWQHHYGMEVAANMQGINNRDFPQVLKNATITMNGYWRSGLAKIDKAPGLSLLYQITTGTDAGKEPNIFTDWFSGYQVIGYGKTVQVYDLVAETLIMVKDDFTADVTDGIQYGAYFYVADSNQGNKISYLSAQLAYDAQTSNFTVGAMVTGQTSGAIAVIIADSDMGATGTLTLNILAGSFQNDEIITDNNGTPGSATVNGTLTVSWTEISGAPQCNVLQIINSNRLAAGNTNSDFSSIHTSRADQLSGVPWSMDADWTIGSAPDSPFITSFQSVGQLRAIGRIGQQAVGLLDRGKYGFRISSISDGTDIILDTPIDFQNVDFGSARGVATTAIGIFYANESGIWQMASGGLGNQPFSAKDVQLTTQLGYEFTQGYSFSNADLVVDEEHQLLLCTAQNNSEVNNVVLVYNLQKELTGWATWSKTVSRWLKTEETIYAASSGSTTIFRLNYEIGCDNDQNNYAELIIEPNSVGGTESLVRPTWLSIAGELGSGSVLVISMDTYDKSWQFTPNAPLNGNGDQYYYFTAVGVSARLPAMGSGGSGAAAMGGRGIQRGFVGGIPNRGQMRLGMGDSTRVRYKVTSLDKFRHTINLLTVYFENRGFARPSNLSTIAP